METQHERKIGIYVDGEGVIFSTTDINEAKQKAMQYISEGKRVSIQGHKIATEEYPTLKRGLEYTTWIDAIKFEGKDDHEKAIKALDKELYFAQKR